MRRPPRPRTPRAAAGLPGTIVTLDPVWVGWSGDVAHPESPLGGGGPGRFRPPMVNDAAEQTNAPSPWEPVPLGTGATPPAAKPPNPPPSTTTGNLGVLKSKQTDLLNVNVDAEILADGSGGPSAGAETKFSGGSAFSSPGYRMDSHHKIVSFDGKLEWRGTIRIQTSYASGARPSDVSCYGRGTTAADVAAGDVTLGFHESCHRADYTAYLKANTLPEPPALAIGMTEGAYRAAVAAFKTALADYFKAMEQQSKSSTDEVGFRLSRHLATRKCFVHVVP
ncbi:MAG TPA: hypothetical protein VHH90_09580 [Polyangia bacterium]|nr:hypothetical protein [Polyangia bacterium]